MYIFLILGILCIITALIALSNKRAKAKTIKQIQSNWGKPNESFINFDHLFSLDKLGIFSSFHSLAEQTKNDIALNDLFLLLNRTTSKVGEQYLYNLLQHPTNDVDELKAFNEKVNYLNKENEQRENIQFILSKLNQPISYNIGILLTEDNWQLPTWYKYANWFTVAMFFSIALCFIVPQFFILIMFLFAFNVFFHYHNKQKNNAVLKGLQQVSNLIIVCEQLQKLNIPFANKEIANSIAALQKFKRQNNFVNFAAPKDELSQFIFIALELIKIFCLWDVRITIKNIKTFFNYKKQAIDLFAEVGKLDSAISIASLRTNYPAICVPVFITNNSTLQAGDIYHPLIENCITNNFELNGKSMFITGSNMSGKSTFLRTVLINSILAQTVCTCFAKSFTTPMLRQFSSIKIEDHLLQGHSYYFEEVTVMKTLLEASINNSPGLFVIDEVFKGTNTVERIAAAKAVLNYLTAHQPNFVLVSSHDIELVDLLNEDYQQYHFSEELIDGKFIYDHQLKTGDVKTTNAIRILEMYGYPISVTNEAKSMIGEL